jgi:predicted AAA+ superfamily ATPase
MPMTVKQACTLNEGALNIRISDGIERVDEETLNEEDGRRFLKHSYLTKGMIELVQEGFKRLSGGQGGRPVFRLKQAMGGGKTHLIKTMAFLARHEPLRVGAD